MCTEWSPFALTSLSNKLRRFSRTVFFSECIFLVYCVCSSYFMLLHMWRRWQPLLFCWGLFISFPRWVAPLANKLAFECPCTRLLDLFADSFRMQADKQLLFSLDRGADLESLVSQAKDFTFDEIAKDVRWREDPDKYDCVVTGEHMRLALPLVKPSVKKRVSSLVRNGL